MHIIIRNAEPAGSTATLVAVVVTSQSTGPDETRHVVTPGGELSINLGENQFVMLDDKES